MFARGEQGRSLSFAFFDEKAVDRVVFEFCEQLVGFGIYQQLVFVSANRSALKKTGRNSFLRQNRTIADRRPANKDCPPAFDTAKQKRILYPQFLFPPFLYQTNHHTLHNHHLAIYNLKTAKSPPFLLCKIIAQ